MKIKLFIYCLIFTFIFSVSCFSLGSREVVFEAEELLKRHPDFVSIEGAWINEIGEDYKINLTEGRTIEFQCIDLRTGGGEYAGIASIGEFNLTSQVEYKEKLSWKDTYGYHVRFNDLSQLLGTKIETMTDCIDNYDKIYELAKKLAIEQFEIGWDSMPEIWYQWDTPLVKQFSGYIFTENRKAKIITSAIYDCGQAYWEEKALEDEKFRKALELE